MTVRSQAQEGGTQDPTGDRFHGDRRTAREMPANPAWSARVLAAGENWDESGWTGVGGTEDQR